MERFGLDSEGLELSYADDAMEKWDLPISADQLVVDALPLGAVYVLEDGPEISISPLGGAAAALALFDHTYRGGFADRQLQWQVEHWRSVASITASVPVFRLARPRDLNLLEALGRAVLDHASALVARTNGAGR